MCLIFFLKGPIKSEQLY